MCTFLGDYFFKLYSQLLEWLCNKYFQILLVSNNSKTSLIHYMTIIYEWSVELKYTLMMMMVLLLVLMLILMLMKTMKMTMTIEYWIKVHSDDNDDDDVYTSASSSKGTSIQHSIVIVIVSININIIKVYFNSPLHSYNCLTLRFL